MSTPPPTPAQALEQILAAEERVYVELRSALQAEHEAMATRDARALLALAQAKETLADEARFCEQSRIAVTRELASELGLEGTDERPPRLSELCDRLGAGARGLRDAHGRLVALLGAVQQLADANAAFAGQSLAQVRATLRLFGRMQPEAPTYGPGGPGAQVSEPSGRIVRRSV